MFKQMPESVKVFARRLGIGQWSLIGPGFEKEVVSFREQSTRRLGPYCGRNVAGIRRKRTSYLSVQRLHCPEVFSRAKDVENCLYISPLIKIQVIQFIALFFLSISSVSAEQWQPYARNLRDHQDGSGEPEVLIGQSIVLGEIKAEVPLQNEDSMNDQTYMAAVHSTS